MAKVSARNCTATETVRVTQADGSYMRYVLRSDGKVLREWVGPVQVCGGVNYRTRGGLSIANVTVPSGMTLRAHVEAKLPRALAEGRIK